MNRCLIVVLLLAVAAAVAQGAELDSDVARLAAFSQTDHSTIFFSGPNLCGYVRDGSVHNLVLRPDTRRSDFSGCSDVVMSHDATRIVYMTEHNYRGPGELILRELSTGEERTLTSFERGGRLFSWSWDDRMVAYQDKGDLLAVSVADGNKSVLIKDVSARVRQIVPRTTDWGGVDVGNVEWLHKAEGWMVSVIVCLQTAPDQCSAQGYVLLITPQGGKLLTEGWCAAISPSSDAVAYFGSGLEVIDVATMAHHRITGTPRFFGVFFEESPWSTVVWSADGDRIWFNTVLDEGGNQSAYVVAVKTGDRQRILKKTLVAASEWRH